MPVFSYGCAVFLQSDIVNFQRQGWNREEILARSGGRLAKEYMALRSQDPASCRCWVAVSFSKGEPKTTWPRSRLRRIYIRARFEGSGVEPEIIVHEHCGVAGAIGTAIEAMRVVGEGHETSFIGVDKVRTITYRSTTNDDTRCVFCTNQCMRTFIDVKSE